MIIIKPRFSILPDFTPVCMLRSIEAAGRTCYKSESLITVDSSITFVRNLIKLGHESVLEHKSISVKIVCDRGVSHELVRHRIASYSQESTRFCNYGKQNHITFIKPTWVSDAWLGEFNFEGQDKVQNDLGLDYIADAVWSGSMLSSEQSYFALLNNGWKPEQARSVLPNSLKTEVIVTMNLRQWRHFLKVRALGTTGKPHPQVLELTVPMLEEFKRVLPVVFDDLIYDA